MNTRIMLTAIATTLLFSACKKKEDDTTTPPATAPSVDNYVKLSPGNYWIYESYYVDSNGVGAPGSDNGGTPFFDSVYVERDMFFNNYTWHKLMSPASGTQNYYPLFFRDSLNYSVSTYGRVYCAPDDFTSVLNTSVRGQTVATPDSASIIIWKMGDKDKTVPAPAGNFTTLAMIASWTFYPFSASGGLPYTRRLITRFAPGVGVVSETLSFYYGDPMYVERRLIRYHVQ